MPTTPKRHDALRTWSRPADDPTVVSRLIELAAPLMMSSHYRQG
jgi:hypothetical protein